MMKIKTKHAGWLLWIAAFGFFIALAVYPASYRTTRAAFLGLGLVVWFGWLVLNWQRRGRRIWWFVVTIGMLALGALPARRSPDVARLRVHDEVALLEYAGVRYFWGGENRFGIDCSGLIRRGMVDALFDQGVRTFDPGLVRQGLDLWWHDCTARDLGDGFRGFTVPVLETPSINALDHSRIAPGDLAVSRTGIHIMAYLGGNRWIEADPSAGRVIEVLAPSPDNLWFQGPMKIVRWSALR